MRDPSSPSSPPLVAAEPATTGPALAKITPPAALDQDPVAVYLAGIGSPKSRRTMRAVLDTIAAELGAATVRAIPWGRSATRTSPRCAVASPSFTHRRR